MHVFLSGKQAQNLPQILKEVQNCCKDKKPQSRAVFPQKNGVPSSTLDQGMGPAIWTGNKYPVVLTYSQGRQNAGEEAVIPNILWFDKCETPYQAVICIFKSQS